MFTNERSELRQFYQHCWQKHQDQQPLETLEQQVVNVLLMHPEYQHLFDQFERYQEKDFTPEMGESNPFLHLSLHMGIQEQVSTNRPQNIRTIHQRLTEIHGQHEAEHKMMECLAEMIWQAQRNNTLPDEQAYLQQLETLL